MSKISDLDENLNIKNLSDSSEIARKDSSEELGVVRKVVEDIVDYVIRKEEFVNIEIPYDFDYIPTTTESPRKKEPCTRHCCQKGCVCGSLSRKVIIKHCKKENCIFHCICDSRLVYSLRKLPHRNTVNIMLSNSSNHSRKPKNHKRVRLDAPASLQEVPIIDLSMDDTPDIPTVEILHETEECVEDNINNQCNITMNGDRLFKSDGEGKLARSDVEKNLLDFREVFVWCPTHCRYICSCQSQVFDLQKNLLLPKSNTDNGFQKPSLFHFFNLDDHCSRTVGSVFNYRLRNVSRIFTLKRDFEIKKAVLSNSNSFFKIDPLKPLPKLVSQLERSATENIGLKSAKNICKARTSNGIQSNCESNPVESAKVASPSSAEPIVQVIFHDNSDSSDDDTEDTSNLPKFGLLCLNGYGYLPIKEFTSMKLVFQHPIIRNIFVSKKDQDEANIWLNDLLKGFMSPESQHIKQQWVVVQRGVLKISKPFNLKNLMPNEEAVN